MASSARGPIIMGIPNCDSVKKARRWLEGRSVDYDFRDVRQQPLSSAELASLIDQIGAAAFVNRGSSSWRALDEAARGVVETAIASPEDSAAQTALVALMAEHQTMIKRPVLVQKGRASTGFSPPGWEKMFEARSE
ncbi:ArsC/Spx/MgsR family protein [Allohahella marinimesophila]|uniref:ArsC family reductase n=1 Tax=Allohahella marinimesophila TaxID=1054972 RepID=A0ABP7P2Y4_9GAMM